MFSLIALVLFPFVIWRAFKNLRLAKESLNWPTTAGSVTVSEKTSAIWRVQPRVSFHYQVDGKDYASSKISFADGVAVGESDSVLDRYPLHQSVRVYYQASDPAVAVLEAGPNRLITNNLRFHLLIFAVLILVNLVNVGLMFWQSKHSSKITRVPTYDDLAKADPQLGNRLIREGAEKGDMKDQTYVAMWYLRGMEGYPKDPAEGAKWLRKAADQGDADSQNRLGILYATGNGVEKSRDEAAKWIKKAAEQGEPHACFSIGYAHETGQGGFPKDMQKAIEWYKKAGNDPNAKAALARLKAN